MKKTIILSLLTLITALLLNSCSSTRTQPTSVKLADGKPHNFHKLADGKPHNFHHFKVEHIPDAKPKMEPRSKYGNPPSYKVFGQRYYVLKSAAGYSKTGLASWYGTKFHRARTSSGEPYDMYAMTAAHKTLPLPSYVRVTNLKTGKKIVVRVNDRGPFIASRIIDLSFVAAKKLGITNAGIARVKVDVININ